ncbi:MAG TPA: bifunctional UDP-N-acetylglucosamine diphosphorylase/glucosamine-1-phosphate N-acetyltransferase GlmU [Mycobacteriales bacterium]|nr:bifunctional UDP-N-acetylglucosamine diphosphorylase/glucosamine-1-phosphate N-acetyltransferase GlmU [Mycobacteriales bacterium]
MADNVDNAPLAAVVVLAAGEGKRMRSELPKVLHAMCGRSLLGHVLTATEPLAADQTLVVVGHGRHAVCDQLAADWPSVKPVEQPSQRGTGDAVRLALEAIPDVADGTVLVVPGDAPLLTTPTLRRLLDRHVETRAAATLLTAELSDPAGYGRVVRDADGHVSTIVEDRDADDRVRQIAEVGTSVYAFEIARLRECLAKVGADNAQGEQYLTDVIGLLVAAKDVVANVSVDDEQEVLGVNDRVQLAAARRAMRDRIVEHWMLSGVTVIDPATTWIGVRVRLEPDCVIHQNTQLHGATTVAKFAEVGPDTTLRATTVGEGASVVKSHCSRAQIGAGATVGPYSYLRPGTVLGQNAKAGAYVELKNASVGDDSKVPHLSYVGDADIGERSNIGAATVFVNYDGTNKHRAKVGDDVRIGSDTMLVAPVSVGDGAYTAAGSVITEDVPPGAMAVARSRQRNVDGWVERKRPGSPSAAAARRAREQAPDGDTMEAGDGSPSPADGSHEGEQGAAQ